MKAANENASARRRVLRRPSRAKVARLPRAIRVEIARRLGDGHSRRAVVLWLNRQGKVAAALRREKSGRAHCRVTDNNLSNWLATKPPEVTSLNLR